MGGVGMTATGLVLLLLGIIGLGVGLYYAYVCLRSRPRRRSPGRVGDVEQGPLISSDPDVNGNHEEGMEGGPSDGAVLMPSKTKKLDEPDANGTVPSGQPQPSAPNHKVANTDHDGPKSLMALDDSSPPQLVPLQMPPDAAMTRALPLAAAAPLLVAPQPEMGCHVEASAPPAPEVKETPPQKAAVSGGSQPLVPGTPGSTPTPPPSASLLPASAPPKSISESDEEDGLLLQSRMHHDDSLDLELQPPSQPEPAIVEKHPAAQPDHAGSPPVQLEPAEPQSVQSEALDFHPAQPQPAEPEAMKSQPIQSEPIEPLSELVEPVPEPELAAPSPAQPESKEPADPVAVDDIDTDQPSAPDPVETKPEEPPMESKIPPEPKVEPEQVTPSAPEGEPELLAEEIAPVPEPTPSHVQQPEIESLPETKGSSEPVQPSPVPEEVPEDLTAQPESEEDPDSVDEDTSPLEDHAPSAPPHYGWRSISEDAPPEEGPANTPLTAPVVVLVPVPDEVPMSREAPLTESEENPGKAVEDLPTDKPEESLGVASPINVADEEVQADKESTDEGTEPSVTDSPVALEDNKVPANEEPVIMEEKPFPISVEPLSERRASEDKKPGDDRAETLEVASREVKQPKETVPGVPREDAGTSTSEESDFESDEDPEVMATFTPKRIDVPDRGPQPVEAIEPLEGEQPLEGCPVACQVEEPIYLEMYQPPEPSIPVRVMLPIEEEERLPEDDDDDDMRCEALAAPGQPPPAYTSREQSQASSEDSDVTDSSEPEVTEYSFSSAPGASSTLGVLADEMVVADPPVTKYTSLDADRGALEDNTASDSASSLEEDEEGVDEGIDVSPPMHRPSQNPPVVVVTPPLAENVSPAKMVVTSEEQPQTLDVVTTTPTQQEKEDRVTTQSAAAEDSESSLSSDEDDLQEVDAEVKEEVVPVTTVQVLPCASPGDTPGVTGMDDELETVYYIPVETNSHQLERQSVSNKEPHAPTYAVEDNQSGSSPNTEKEDGARVEASDADESLAKSTSSKIPRLMKP